MVFADHWLEQLNVARCRPISDHLHRLSSLSKGKADDVEVRHITLKELMAQVTGRDVILAATCNLMENVKPSPNEKEKIAEKYDLQAPYIDYCLGQILKPQVEDDNMTLVRGNGYSLTSKMLQALHSGFNIQLGVIDAYMALLATTRCKLPAEVSKYQL